MKFTPIKEYVSTMLMQLQNEVATFRVQPVFYIIQVNDDPASNSYIKGKLNDAAQVGIDAVLTKLPETTSEEELLVLIKKLNKNPAIDGLIVQMPLPKHINEEKIKLAVNPLKDIDGFHPLSPFDPCTPKGIINYLMRHEYQISGKNAVIIGRSNIVGKPMAKLLLKQSANTTVLHSKTKPEDMAFYLGHADIIVCAVGIPYFLDQRFDYQKEAIIFDVGINRVDGVLRGDVLTELDVTYQSPVPGGVGLLTRLTLLENLLEAYKNGI